MKEMMEGDTGREMLEPQEKSTRFFIFSLSPLSAQL